ncbi:MAG: cation:proton antiporter [Sphingobacteriales bacterium]|nr:cation:proton antiporter [Sphingobacteriales bacterium]
MISSTASVADQFIHNIKSPLGLLLLQIITILSVSKLFGLLFSTFGQQTVVGEMIAGIFLGPSIIGVLFPAFSAFLFPKTSLPNLQFLSQIGLVLFMFIIGMELDIEKLKHKAHNALVISHASIIFPYFLGVLSSYILYEQFAPANVSFLSFSLFLGIAVSITAFPVLARILQERNMSKTALGTMVLTCAAADDVTAWCILAVVVAIVKAGSVLSALFTIGLAVIFVIIMIYVVRPFVTKLSNNKKHNDTETVNKTLMAIVFFILISAAYIAEIIGIHALFGAFLAGAIMPQKIKFRELLADKIEDISVMLLLPIFFAFTGLRTQIGLLSEGHLWAYCGLIIFIAVLGKLGGSSIAAKLVGYSWKDSFSIGTLMNTRGLMELIVLNIGYDLGILSPSIFAIMVLMALTTTFMTGPLLNLIDYFDRKK